jgi:hypothetical protein
MELLLLSSRSSASCAGDRLFIPPVGLCGDSEDVASVSEDIVKFALFALPVTRMPSILRPI